MQHISDLMELLILVILQYNHLYIGQPATGHYNLESMGSAFSTLKTWRKTLKDLPVFDRADSEPKV